MQWILFLLVLMGQCSFFTCQVYEYHFIREEKNWDKAQAYCREHYTDLATVFDMTDMTRLGDVVDERGAWIGLYNVTGGEMKRKWHWSLPGVEYYKNNTWWKEGEPNDMAGFENCAAINTDYKLIDVPCDTGPQSFICYDESMKSSERFHLMKKETWLKAQKYCREHHTDLISGYDQLKNLTITQTPWLWIGLFRDSWRWSDGSRSSFRDWENLEASQCNKANKNCGVIKKASGQLRCRECDKMKPFVCYDDKVILINQKKTWDEAVNYCREKYRDLASITDRNEQKWIQEKAKNASTEFVWLGLRYTCTLDFWFWVSDEAVSYKNWASSTTNDDCDMSGAIERGGEHKWVKKDDAHKFNFFCSKC